MSHNKDNSNKISVDLQATYQQQITTSLSEQEKHDKLVADGLRIMEPPGEQLLVRMGLLPSSPGSFSLLDNACGVGPIASRLIAGMGGSESIRKNGCRLVCADVLPGMVEGLKRRAGKEGWDDGVIEAMVLDARVSSSFVYFFVALFLSFFSFFQSHYISHVVA